MTSVLKVTNVGNLIGVILPEDVLEKLHVQNGDTLFAVETPNGIELTAQDPEFARQVKIAEQMMHEDREALQKLAE